MGDAFAGWKGDFQGFFLGLQADNSKAYWEAHRRTYEEAVKGPMVALLADLEPEFGPARLARPYRDVRFSADKSPYKTNIYADARGGGYVALDASGLVAAGGRYMLDAPELACLRGAIAADDPGEDLVAIVGRLRGRGYEIGGQELKRVPPPYPKDHPRADLLRHKRLIYWRRWDVGPWIATPEARERVAAAWRDGRELNAWLGRHVNGGER
ncbi:MAG TPA: DUF2461 domain-containing protein [Candidatus Dormibacteraeota bacterium]|nr:DUF2461 domain-containing protein [Candidatus Dormibacteraeota bacterium]